MTMLANLLHRQGQPPVGYTDGERKIFAASLRIGLTVLAFGAVGVVLVALWARGLAAQGGAGTTLGFGAMLGGDLLVGAAAGAAGALFGFIFGIPRTLDPASRAAVANAAAQGGPAAASHAVMAANTNLERISDWLTMLLLGATLVQIKDIARWVGGLGHNLFSGTAANDAIVPIVVIYFFALAFLGVYLITRLYLTSAFEQTLGLLAGAAGPALQGLRDKFAAAVASGKADDITAALALYDAWSFADGERDDPGLNADLARLLARAIAANAAPARPGGAEAELRIATAKAAADPAARAQLKTEQGIGTFTTKNAALDGQLAALLG